MIKNPRRPSMSTNVHHSVSFFNKSSTGFRNQRILNHGLPFDPQRFPSNFKDFWQKKRKNIDALKSDFAIKFRVIWCWTTSDWKGPNGYYSIELINIDEEIQGLQVSILLQIFWLHQLQMLNMIFLGKTPFGFTLDIHDPKEESV